MLTAAFWTGLIDRAAKTFAQQLVILLLGQHVLNLWTVDWVTLLGTAGAATLLSVLTSLGSAPVGNPGTTSFLPGGV